MGRWSNKPASLRQGYAPSATEPSSAKGVDEVVPAATAPINPALSPEQDAVTAEDVAANAFGILEESSLSEAQKQQWQEMSKAVAIATPSADTTKTGPPDPQMLAALQSARMAREKFLSSLASEHDELMKRLLELEKLERKLRVKESTAQWKAQNTACAAAQARTSKPEDALKKKQKEIMTHAFELWQRDQQKTQGSNKIDSTEWKRIRAIGGKDPILQRYIKLAGWEPSWPMPEPEGRLLRREGQSAAVAHYSKK